MCWGRQKALQWRRECRSNVFWLNKTWVSQQGCCLGACVEMQKTAKRWMGTAWLKWKSHFRVWMCTVPWNSSVTAKILPIYFPTISDFTGQKFDSVVRRSFPFPRSLLCIIQKKRKSLPFVYHLITHVGPSNLLAQCCPNVPELHRFSYIWPERVSLQFHTNHSNLPKDDFYTEFN